jgi:hypothetical protein
MHKTRGKAPEGVTSLMAIYGEMAIYGAADGLPDDHLWSKPGEKRPLGATGLMIIYGRW